MTEIFAYIAAIAIGISLGLIGSGGSILTVPVLVYLLGVSPVQATAYSLFIVGISALSGAVNMYRKSFIDLKAAVTFAIPSTIAVFLTRKYLLPAIPETVFKINEIIFSKDLLIMLLFAILMFFTAFFMIGKRKVIQAESNPNKSPAFVIMIEGFVVGILTGLVGAGGGFLIIPALVFFAGLPMKVAVGTSLAIIALKSLIGFTGDVATQQIDWLLLLSFTLLAVAGIIIGGKLSNKFSGEKLKPIFGWFILLMSVYIMFKELYAL